MLAVEFDPCGFFLTRRSGLTEALWRDGHNNHTCKLAQDVTCGDKSSKHESPHADINMKVIHI